MFCVNCFNKDTRVTNSRPHKKRPSVWRRRKCAQCGTIFTTYERPSLSENKPVHLTGGKTEEFNPGKLIISITHALTHLPQEAVYNALWLAQTVEDTLSTECEVVTPEEIAATTHAVLKRYDELAAIQYAARHQLIISARKRGRPSWRGRHEPPNRPSPSR